MNLLSNHWTFDPFLVIALAVVAVHENGLRNLRSRSVPGRTRTRRIRSLLFYAGLAVLVLAVMSPTNYWGDRYFYVHIIDHILLMFLAPTLVVAGAPWIPLVHGIPVAARRRLLRAAYLGPWSRPIRWAARTLTGGWLAVVAFSAVMIAWHLPALFDPSVTNADVRVWLMHSSFFAAGVLFWMQIMPSYPFHPRLSTGNRIAAILFTNVVMVIVAMALSILTNHSWYPVYDHLRGVQMSPFASQQIGAAVLWVCGDFWAYPALVLLFRRAMSEEGGATAVFDRFLHVSHLSPGSSRG